MAVRLAGRPRHRCGEPALEFESVDQAGQSIMAGLISEARSVFAFTAHVVQHQHHADGIARTATDQCHRGLDGDQRSRPQHQQQRRALLPASFQRRLHQIRYRCMRDLVFQHADPVQRHADSLLAAPSGQSLCRRIERVDLAADIGSDDCVPDRLQRHLGTLLLRENLGFRALVVGDIGQRARHAQHAARGGAHQASARAYP